MVEMLNNFQRVLHSLPKGHMSQLHSDVSKLQHYLEDRMSSLQCTHRKADTEKNLEAFLKNHNMYYITLGHMALDRLQKYLQRLNHNLDQLRTCWTEWSLCSFIFYYCCICYIYLYQRIYGPNNYLLFYFFLDVWMCFIHLFGNQTWHSHGSLHIHAHRHTRYTCWHHHQPSIPSEVTVLPEASWPIVLGSINPLILFWPPADNHYGSECTIILKYTVSLFWGSSHL